MRRESGLTLVEIMIATVIAILALGIILSFQTMGQRFLKAGMNQMDITRAARKSLERISRDIRSATAVAIYDDYATPPSGGSPGNYIRIGIPSGSDVGYYLNAQGEIYYIDSLFGDIAGEADDEKIADEIVGTNIFAGNGGGIEITFSLQDNYAKDGYQGLDFQTRAEPRNRPPATETGPVIGED